MPRTAPMVFICTILASASAFSFLTSASCSCALALNASSDPAAAMCTSLFTCLLLMNRLIALNCVDQAERVRAPVGSKNYVRLHVAGLHIHSHDDSGFKRL